MVWRRRCGRRAGRGLGPGSCCGTWACGSDTATGKDAGQRRGGSWRGRVTAPRRLRSGFEVIVILCQREVNYGLNRRECDPLSCSENNPTRTTGEWALKGLWR